MDCSEKSGSLVSFDEVRFDVCGLVPCVVQDASTREVLMVAWMSAESLRLTIETGYTWFWSRSRQELWNKGATSGNLQKVQRLFVDCDGDTLLAEVDALGPACHTGNDTCFFREILLTAPERGEKASVFSPKDKGGDA